MNEPPAHPVEAYYEQDRQEQDQNVGQCRVGVRLYQGKGQEPQAAQNK